MPDVAKRLAGPTSLTASSATIYTATGVTAIMRNIRIANTTNTTARVFVSIGADAAGTRIWSNVAIPAYDALDWSGFMVLGVGETLRAYSDTASALTITVSGVESS